MSGDDRKMLAYRRMIRRRRALCIGGPIGALVLLIIVQAGVGGLPMIAGWPILLVFVVAIVASLHATDRCPWCQQSFHNDASGKPQGFRDLFRRQCANCGKPENR